MLDLIKEVGSYAGLAAFLGVGVLALLHFAQARDVRRLRDWAGRAPERDAELVDATSSVAAERADELRRIEEERRRAEEAREADRRAAALREKRRQRREQGLPEQTRLERVRERIGAGEGRRPAARYVALIVAAVIVLGGGIAFGALAVLGGDEDGAAKGRTTLSRSDIEVAVLNGTAVPGLANRTGDQLENGGFQLGAVTNSNSSFSRSVVMYREGFRPEGQMVAKDLRIRRLQSMAEDIAALAAGANVAVVVGEDRAGGTPG
ncbi:MAG TPA: LytR C-terminal domain-containing protein [Solirubrobacterales bacterium]|nr:LytR C-terminal domain-containing protein [Solirubrobacterales bacterium]